MRIRYLLVDHHCDNDFKLHWDGNKMCHVPSIHIIAPVYHWARLDDATIFVKAKYHEVVHHKLMAMPRITVLPATFSRNTVMNACMDQGNHHHHRALVAHRLPYHAGTVTADMVDWMAQNVSPIFDHEH